MKQIQVSLPHFRSLWMHVLLIFLWANAPAHSVQPEKETWLSKPLRSEVSILWEARILEPGGVFVVYRTDDRNTFEVARIVPNETGKHHVIDRHVSSGRSVYQLRYRDRDNIEHVLMTSTVHFLFVDSEQDGGWLQSSTVLATLSAWRSRTAFGASDNLLPSGRVHPDSAHQEPSVPPPRWDASVG